jgi:hypothetical protein
MSDIFISYAREDRDKAKALAKLFQQQGWSVWWDRNIPPGRSFDEVIEEALGAAKCVVVLWSKNSASSDWVKGEAAEALQRKILVPVRIDSANVPLEFRRLQTVDLSNWKGGGGHPELGGLLEAVAAHTKGVVRRPVKEESQRQLTKRCWLYCRSRRFWKYDSRSTNLREAARDLVLAKVGVRLRKTRALRVRS